MAIPAPGSWRPLRTNVPADDMAQSGPPGDPDPRRFQAFGIERVFGDPGFWVDPGGGLLFLFHLHGYGDLQSYALSAHRPEHSAAWQTIVEDWLRLYASPALPAWHPYPLSERLVAWTIAVSTLTDWPPALRDAMAHQVWREAVYLSRFPEFDVGGNHLIQNAVGLVFAGCLFPDSRLKPRGLALLKRELRRQFLPDGGHLERSPAYHRRLVRRLQQVEAALNPEEVPGWLTAVLARAERWQESMVGPDGSLPLFNDAWHTPTLRVGDRPEIEVLPDTGFLVLRSEKDQLTVDAGPLAPQHLPPHAHADALSFVLWIDGCLVVADPGCLSYEGPHRASMRGTAAHSTVAVDDADQCVFWGPFRAAAMPNVSFAEPLREDEFVLVRTAHDGYRRLADPVIHRRTFLWLPGDGLVVVDLLDSRLPHRVTSSLPLAADITPSGGAVRSVAVQGLGAATRDPDIVARDCAPYMGQLYKTKAFVYSGDVKPWQPFGWSLLRSSAQIDLDVERIRIAREGKPSLSIDLHWDRPLP